jgi:CubicO group peptidase (beta-lactamase class C family)
VLVDRGEIALDAPVARYWPEFAQAGKARVLVRHLLAHRAGVVGIRAPRLPPDVWLAWDEMVWWLEREEPWWPPGEHHGYHALTYGHLVGELVRRVSGVARFRDFVAAQISGPLGIDFHIGVPDGHAGPVADIVRRRYDPSGYPADDSAAMRMNNPPDPGMGWRNAAEWRRADVPAVNGHATATGLARLAALFAGGGELGGVRLLRAATVAEALRVQAAGVDWFGYEARWGLGVSFHSEHGFAGGVGGGGAQLWLDPVRRLGFGYVQNTDHPPGDVFLPGNRLLARTVAIVDQLRGGRA